MNRLVRLGALVALLLFAGGLLPMASAATNQVPTAPAAVVLTIIPPKLPSDGQSYSAAIVSLADSSNLPTAAIGNVTVFLSSSLPNIAAVPDSVTIYAGQEYAIANLTTTTTPGSAMITAHSEGLNAPQPVQVTTVTPSGYPSKLVVYTSPSVFLPRADSGVLRVEVVDDAGLPSKAISAIPVSLFSSNSSIVSLGQSSLTIAAGSIIADGTIQTSSPGSAVISAVSSGYSTGTGLVTVNKPAQSNQAYKLAMRLVPGTLPTDGQTYSVLEVGLQTSTGSPATLSSDTVVQLTSDNPDVASVQNLITIPAGRISMLAPVTTSALAGVANVTATAAGLLPTTIPVKTIIPAPSKLQEYLAPPSSAFFANGNHPILVVQLQDSSGNPARARQDTTITVTSSNGTLLSSFISLKIPRGDDYVFTYLNTKGVGDSKLTATSQGLTSSLGLDLKSVPSPLQVNLILASTSNFYIYQNQTATFTFSATLDGAPIQNLNVTWAVSGGNLVPSVGNTGKTGSTSSVFTPGDIGRYTINASVNSAQTGNVLKTIALVVAETPQKPAPSLIEQIVGFWYYIVAAVAVVIVAVVYLLRMRRKKQRAEIEAGFEVV